LGKKAPFFMHLELAQLPLMQGSKTKGDRLTTGPTAICHMLGVLGGNEHFAALLLKVCMYLPLKQTAW